MASRTPQNTPGWHRETTKISPLSKISPNELLSDEVSTPEIDPVGISRHRKIETDFSPEFHEIIDIGDIYARR